MLQCQPSLSKNVIPHPSLRFVAAIQTQIATEAAHGMRLVRNPDEIRFTLREREMIGMVSERTVRS